MIAEGFEPTKHDARELESLPFDRSGTLPKIALKAISMTGFEPATFRLEV